MATVAIRMVCLSATSLLRAFDRLDSDVAVADELLRVVAAAVDLKANAAQDVDSTGSCCSFLASL
jgi:hypothetical protein